MNEQYFLSLSYQYREDFIEKMEKNPEAIYFSDDLLRGTGKTSLINKVSEGKPIFVSTETLAQAMNKRFNTKQYISVENGLFNIKGTRLACFVDDVSYEEYLALTKNGLIILGGTVVPPKSVFTVKEVS